MPTDADRCVRCGASTGRGRLVVANSADDPLQVYECGACGAVVRVGGHEW
ncbi:hypothetical protein ABNG02_07465 [Halorubrum ejinorense]